MERIIVEIGYKACANNLSKKTDKNQKFHLILNHEIKIILFVIRESYEP